MKQVIGLITTAFLMLGFSGIASADKWVNGYTKKDGTYVQGYYRSSPDQYRYNNRNSQTNGGTQRDEYSSGFGATNKSNPSYYYRDNDNDGIQNQYDPYPESKQNNPYCTGLYCN